MSSHLEKQNGSRFPIVGIGASAGGLEALTGLLRHLPPDTGMGFVFVQHLAPERESALTRILRRTTSMPVYEAVDNLSVEANHIYVIPPNRLLTIVTRLLKLHPRSKPGAPLRTINFFLEALARDQQACAIGIILSGVASDGTLGLCAVKEEGGITFAQDQSANFDSMPRNAIAAGCADFVLPPSGIAEELGRIANAFLPGACCPGARKVQSEGGKDSGKKHTHRRINVEPLGTNRKSDV